MHSLLLPRSARLRLISLAVLAAIAVFASCTSDETPTETPTSTASPTATQAPTATSTATPSPSPTGISTPGTPTPEPAQGELPIPPERDLYDIANRLVLKNSDPISRQATPTPPTLRQGDSVQWTVSRDQGNVTVNAKVSLVTENAYWVFEDAYPPDMAQLVVAAEEFESVIWPTVTGNFGNIWSPGVDGDPRLVIFHGKLRSGVAGYYSSVDEYPKRIQPGSNEREVIYISVDNLAVGSSGYNSTLAHELQHAVHWAFDPGEDSWINEGISELASKLAGYPPGSVNAFLRAPNTPLLDWEPNIFQASPNYGAASLFFEYLYDHYGGAPTIKAIIENQSDSIESVDETLDLLGYDMTMVDVFTDWIVANFADDASGAYSHPNRNTPQPFSRVITAPREMDEAVRPFGSNYYTLSATGDTITIEFSGATQGQVFPAQPRSGSTCWWTNTGDSIDSTLTRSVDLKDVNSATLSYHAWTSIEFEWDYMYVEVSTDNGATWDILPTALTSDSNPNGSAFGPGITGASLGWIEDTVDLSAYAGQEVLLRFEHITDDAVHGRGACLDDFSIPEIGWRDDTSDGGGWTAAGFARINEKRPVEFVALVIRDTPDDPAVVEAIDIAADGKGSITVDGPAVGERLAIVISVVTPGVSGELEYTLNVS